MKRRAFLSVLSNALFTVPAILLFAAGVIFLIGPDTFWWGWPFIIGSFMIPGGMFTHEFAQQQTSNEIDNANSKRREHQNDVSARKLRRANKKSI